METLSKLYLELAHVVPPETKNFRELAAEQAIKKALWQLAESAPLEGGGPIQMAANTLRTAVGLPPLNDGEKPSSGL